MNDDPRSDPRERTDDFRHDSRSLGLGMAGLGALLVLTLVATAVGPGFDPAAGDPLWAALAFLFLTALVVALLWVMHRRPVLLRVGPDGIDMPLAWRRPLPWSAIHRFRRLPETRHNLQRQDWLRLDPSPGVLPDYRLRSLRRLELWHMRRFGIRIGLHALEAPPEEVIASIGRYRPVTPADG